MAGVIGFQDIIRRREAAWGLNERLPSSVL